MLLLLIRYSIFESVTVKINLTPHVCNDYYADLFHGFTYRYNTIMDRA